MNIFDRGFFTKSCNCYITNFFLHHVVLLFYSFKSWPAILQKSKNYQRSNAKKSSYLLCQGQKTTLQSPLKGGYLTFSRALSATDIPLLPSDI